MHRLELALWLLGMSVSSVAMSFIPDVKVGLIWRVTWTALGVAFATLAWHWGGRDRLGVWWSAHKREMQREIRTVLVFLTGVGFAMAAFTAIMTFFAGSASRPRDVWMWRIGASALAVTLGTLWWNRVGGVLSARLRVVADADVTSWWQRTTASIVSGAKDAGPAFAGLGAAMAAFAAIMAFIPGSALSSRQLWIWRIGGSALAVIFGALWWNLGGADQVRKTERETSLAQTLGAAVLFLITGVGLLHWEKLFDSGQVPVTLAFGKVIAIAAIVLGGGGMVWAGLVAATRLIDLIRRR